MKDQTIAIHAGFKSDSATKAVSVPIYQTVAYEFDSAQHGADLFNLEVEGNIYTRIMNPTTAVLEERCAALEEGIAGLGLSAGSAAVNYSILNIAEQGSNIVTVPLLYGGTYTLFKHMLPRQGIDVRLPRTTARTPWRSTSTTRPRRSSASRSATRPAISSISKRLRTWLKRTACR